MQPSQTSAAAIFVSILFLVLVSAVWIETDSYRVAALVLVLWGMAHYYFRASFRVSIGWMGALCLAWVAYVIARYLFQMSGHLEKGASEGIYLLPAFYMTVGYMMYVYREIISRTVALTLLISFAAVAATVHPIMAFDGLVHDFLSMNNSIHSSVCGGLIILAALNFSAYAGRVTQERRLRWCLQGLSGITIALTVIGIYGAKSKGVWAALVVAFIAQFLVTLRSTLGARAVGAGTLLAIALLVFIWALAPNIWATIGPSYGSAASIVLDALHTGHPMQALREAIASGSVPASTNIRLMLWHNAIEVISLNPLFGSGIGWLDLFRQATYRDTGFDVVHNGYLEVAMRYGLLGLLFYAALYGWTVMVANRALKAGLIAPEAFRFHVVALIFFFGTLISNSNNRLAVGETVMLLAAAFGFYCLFRLQAHRRLGGTDAH